MRYLSIQIALSAKAYLFDKIGAPGEIRTHDLCLRRAALYPAELRVPCVVSYDLGIVRYSRFAASARPLPLAARLSNDELSKRFIL